MTSFDQLKEPFRVKLLLCGDTGAGKTASLATLANAGYKVRVLDFEGNLRIIGSYLSSPEAAKLISSITFQVNDDDKLLKANKAVTQMRAILEKGWTHDGESLGPITSWGVDTVLVFDTTTSMGKAFLRHALLKAGKSLDEEGGFNQEIWLMAQRGMWRVLEEVCGPKVKCNVIFNAHIKYQGETATSQLTRMYPTAVGSAMGPDLGQLFTDVWRIDTKPDRTKVLVTQSDHTMGLKCSNPKAIPPVETLDLGAAFKKLLA